MKKLVAESLNEYSKLQDVNEELLTEAQINESILDQYNKLNKEDGNSVRKFAFELAKKKYVPGPNASNDAAFKLFKQLCEKSDIQKLQQFLQNAAADKFAGRTILQYADPQAKTGRILGWKNATDVKPESQFKSGGTGGKTANGGA